MFHVEQGRGTNSLSQNLTVLPAPSEREPLAYRPQASSPSQALRASSPKGRATGETGDFAICPITFPLCQRPHPRGGCRRRRLGEFRQIPPQAHYVRQLPQGDAFALCRKPYRYRQKPSPWGRWLRPTGADGRGNFRASNFVPKPETHPLCQGLSLWESCHRR